MHNLKKENYEESSSEATGPPASSPPPSPQKRRPIRIAKRTSSLSQIQMKVFIKIINFKTEAKIL